MSQGMTGGQRGTRAFPSCQATQAINGGIADIEAKCRLLVFVSLY